MKQKVFLINFYGDIGWDVALKLKKHPIQIDYWLCGKSDFYRFIKKKNEFPNTFFHSNFDAIRGFPAQDIDTSDFAPPGKNLIHNFFETESFVLDMMDRFNHSNIPHQQKKLLYYKYLQYWYNILNRFKPDAILFWDIPHLVCDMVIHDIAKKMNINIIMSHVVNFSDRLIFFNDYKEYKKIKEGLKDTEGYNFKIDDLKEDVKNEYKKHINLSINTTPFFVKKDFRIKKAWYANHLFPSVRVVWKNIKNFSLIKVFFNFLYMQFKKAKMVSLEGGENRYILIKLRQMKWQKKKKRYKKEYLHLETTADFSKDFIYVPLHFQPECSTGPMGDVFFSQILMIKILSFSLPDNWIIYVKENPNQFIDARGHLGRYDGYYKEITNLKNVKLVPLETQTYDMITYCKAVASVTGTACLEAILRSKPALIFGSVWFMHCEGIFNISDAISCKAALADIKNGYYPEKQKVRNCIKIMDDNTIKAYPYQQYQRDLYINYQENIQNITNAYIKRINI